MDSRLIPYAALALLPVAAALNLTALLRAKKACGKKEASLNAKIHPALFLLIPLSVLLIAACFFRDFSLGGSFAVCGCGILGFYLSLREFCFRAAAGIYENGCILSPGFFLFRDAEEAESPEDGVLAVTTKTREKKMFQIHNAGRAKILAALREKNPRAQIR